MTFNPQRAEALRTAIHQTAQCAAQFKTLGDVATLLTEHLALLQEAELIFLTDAFVGEGEETGESYSELLKKTYEPIFQAYIDPRKDESTGAHAELRKTWAPGQRWQVRWWGRGAWKDSIGSPAWHAVHQYRRHPDDIDQPPKPWYPDDSGEWVEVPDDCMTCPVPVGTRIRTVQLGERLAEKYNSNVCKAEHYTWGRLPEDRLRVVAYKVVR